MNKYLKILLLSTNALFISFGLFAFAISLKSNFNQLELSINSLSESILKDASQSLPTSSAESLDDLNTTVREISSLLMLAGIAIRGILISSVFIILLNSICIIRLTRPIKEIGRV